MKLAKYTFVLVLLGFVVTASSQDQIEQRDITVQHIVKPGETLHKITRLYLGTDILWQDNWKLNPNITNPNKLKIGQELTIIKERIIPAEKAKVFNVVNRVEKKRSEGDWSSANNGDELVQQEGVRTFAKSSALLEFNDESRLKVLEFSQIFLQSRSTTLTGTDSATIEVVKGDAELSWEPLKNNDTDISIITGGTTLKPKAVAGKIAELRTGLTESGNSVISVYQGNSEVASAGTEVNVKQGMGLAVKPGQAPPEPKPLLPAPGILKSVEAIYSYTNPILNWTEVDGAAGYVIEICSDIYCQQVLLQHKIKENQWQLTDFLVSGEYFLRVGAISPDEIMGFRSVPQKLSFTSNEEDNKAPIIGIEIDGNKTYIDDVLVIGPDAKVNLYSVDEHSGVKAIQYRWDDGLWQDYHYATLDIPDNGVELSIKSVDMLNQQNIKSYQFLYK